MNRESLGDLIVDARQTGDETARLLVKKRLALFFEDNEARCLDDETDRRWLTDALAKLLLENDA
ncbi:MAG: hypothetical protein KGR26_15640 [Cyanobacteria bacterium REEB65]|nr:hypothetical protein [Cyanobacteria bacterium REEB65]